MQEMIETIALSKEFKDFWGRIKVKALDHLNLKVYRGEIFGLLGPNGSGKTTTIKLLLGLLFPSNGKIKILGKSPQYVKNKKYIGFLPEESYLYPYQNAEESLFFYGKLFGLSQSLCRKRVEDLLDMVGLTKARTRLLKEYSKGMARRIGIAQALINDPELIILDEPTTGLDPIGTKEIKDLILHLKKCGKTIVLCSHLLADVEDICDRIAILYGGKVRCEGTVSQLLTKPQAVQVSLERIGTNKLQELQNWLCHQKIQAKLEQPREKLEKFFLRIVEEARTQQVPTYGAEAGKIVQGLFSEKTPTSTNEVIAQLLGNSNDPIFKQEPLETEIVRIPKEKDLIQELLPNPEISLSTQENEPTPPIQKNILQELLPKSPSQEE